MVELGGECNITSDCRDANVECTETPASSGMFSCQCPDAFHVDTVGACVAGAFIYLPFEYSVFLLIALNFNVYLNYFSYPLSINHVMFFRGNWTLSQINVVIV